MTIQTNIAPPKSWDAALADYRAKCAIVEAMPLGTKGEDDAVNTCCAAMDHLVISIPAPNIAAVATKVELVMACSDFDEEYQEAILADLRRLAAEQ